MHFISSLRCARTSPLETLARGGRRVSPAVYPYLPWCGAPPDPSLIWLAWRLDPLVVSTLGLLFGWLAGRIVRADHRSRSLRLALFSGGWTIATLALVSPLCPLSVSLFSARASQHMLLTMIAAPLVAAGLEGLLSRPSRIRSKFLALIESPLAAAFAFAAIVWFWHAPSPYGLTFESATAYWSMHVTMFGSAVWLWHRLVGRDAMPIETLLASLVSTVQMGFLGALISLAPRPLYAPHLLTTDAWGLAPLEDQQLGGAVMWVLGCVAFLVVSMISLRALLQRRVARVDVPRFGQPV
jgi:putative membrane protein